MEHPTAFAAQDITTELVTRRLSAKLRSLMGPGRRWTYSGVAQLTGIDVRSLQAYTRGETSPNLAKYKRLLSVLGPELAVDLDKAFAWPARIDNVAPESVGLSTVADELRACLLRIDAAVERARAEAPASRGKTERQTEVRRR